LNRGLAVLERLAAGAAGLSVKELASQLQIPASATHRILTELVLLGFVRQHEEHGRYTLTLKLCSLGLAQLSRGGIVDVAQPILDQLAQASGELARLGVVDGDELIWVAKAQGATAGLRFDPDMGGVAPLASTASGHAWLSCLAEGRALELVARQGGLRPASADPGKNAPASIAELLMHLQRARTRGYALLAEAVHVGIAAVAAPVRHAGSGEVIAVLSVAGAHLRLTDSKMAKLGPVLVQAAADLAHASVASPLLRKASGSRPARPAGAAPTGKRVAPRKRD
jgi:DNA-binding IclR family transcriptional regulator